MALEVTTYLGASIAFGLLVGLIATLILRPPGNTPAFIAVLSWTISAVALSIISVVKIPAEWGIVVWPLVSLLGFGVGVILAAILLYLYEISKVMNTLTKREECKQ